MHNTASELYNKLLGIYFDESDAERKKKLNSKYKPQKLFIKGCNYNDWYKNVEPPDKEESINLSDMPPLEDEEEDIKEGKG